MTDLLLPIGMFAAGGALAGVWLAGLWLNVRNLAARPRPFRRLLAGAVGRLAVVAAGFYLVIAGSTHWVHLVAALAGFMVMRTAVIALAQRRGGSAAAGGGPA